MNIRKNIEISPIKTPKTIVSLVPSITELLAYLELDNEVKGITKFCVEPNHWFKNKSRIGGTKTPKLDIILALKPDLVIANKEENVKEHIEALVQHVPVYVSDVKTLDDALQMINDIGLLCKRKKAANKLIAELREKAKIQAEKLAARPRKIAAYFIWRKPWMVAGGDTFINDMMQYAGYVNAFAHLYRYPEVSLQEIQVMQPEVLLLSSEPYPFKQKHLLELQEMFPNTQIRLVDGMLYSWYGSRLLQAFEVF